MPKVNTSPEFKGIKKSLAIAKELGAKLAPACCWTA
jgi:hypothetical protein